MYEFHIIITEKSLGNNANKTLVGLPLHLQSHKLIWSGKVELSTQFLNQIYYSNTQFDYSDAVTAAGEISSRSQTVELTTLF